MGKGAICVLGAWAIATAACGARDPQSATPGGGGERAEASRISVPHVDPELCDPGGKEVLTYDLDHDGEPNIWELYETVEQDGTDVDVQTCKQIDFDGDSRKDYVATYGETGEMLAEEFDLTFDGDFDVRSHYDAETGRVYLTERASGFGEGYDVWEKYDGDGKLQLVERDRSGDGNPDMWEQYEEGELLAILYDDTSDGRVDRREDRPSADDEEADAPAAGGSAPAGDEDSDAPAAGGSAPADAGTGAQ